MIRCLTLPEALREVPPLKRTLMGAMGASATPAIYYLDGNGRLQQQQGAPRPDSLAKIMGPLSPKR